MYISSKDNNTLKFIQKLSFKKYRDEAGLFVVEGVRAVNDVLSFDKSLVDKIFVAESKADLYPTATVVKDDIFDRITETVNGQGVLAIVKKPRPVIASSPYAIFLDGVRDPGNLGTLIRTACAAGYNDVYLRDCADPYGGKVVRSTMSAIVKVNIFSSGIDELKELKQLGYSIITADMGGKSAFSRCTMRDKVCIVVGGEAQGVSKEVMELSDDVYSLPMEGDIESLNAAVCGAVFMYTIKYNKEGK